MPAMARIASVTGWKEPRRKGEPVLTGGPAGDALACLLTITKIFLKNVEKKSFFRSGMI